MGSIMSKTGSGRSSSSDSEYLLQVHSDDEESIDYQLPQTPRHVTILVKGSKLALAFTYSLETIAVMQILLRSDNPKLRAAAALIVTLMNAVGAPIGMMPYGAMTKIAELKGGIRTPEERDSNINAVSRDAYKIIAIPTALGTLLLALAPYILTALNQDPEVVAYTGEFTQPFAVALPFYAVRMLMEQKLIAYGDNSFAMTVGLTSFSVGTLLAVLANSGYMGEWLADSRGIAGSYAATEIVTAVAFILRTRFAARYPQNLASATSYTRELLRKGGPIALSAFMEMLVAVVLSVLAGLLHGDAQENMSDALQIPVTLFVFILAISIQYNEALSSLKGGELYAEASRIARHGLLMVLAIGAILCAVPMAIPGQFLKAVGYHDHSQAQAMVRIACATAVVDGGRQYILNELRTSLEDPNIPTIISVSCLWLGVGIGTLLGFATDLAATGLILGFLIGVTMGFLLNAPRFIARTSEWGLEHLQETARTRVSMWLPCCREQADSAELNRLLSSNNPL